MQKLQLKPLQRKKQNRSVNITMRHGNHFRVVPFVRKNPVWIPGNSPNALQKFGKSFY